VPAHLALANSFLLTKDVDKARSTLKRISKMKVNPDHSEELVKSWLMLTNMYIANNKFDMASELCRKVLHHNKSSAKAYEFLGLIHEKEQCYRDAAEHYEKAWAHTNEASPSTGYKLAFNYLKAKNYVGAITVCHRVLSQHPNYPAIRKDVLDVARAALRP
jgi:tetratricopeptide (TPR) repeat protein